MDTALYISFLLVSFGLIIVPGPNVLVIVSTSVTYGSRRGLQTVAGTSLAMSVQLLVAAVGTSSFVHLVSDGLLIVKWLGVAYLCYLGLVQLRKAWSVERVPVQASAAASFTRGFIVSLTNPKTIFFFSAFLPQFISREGSYALQSAVLSTSFLLLAILLDSAYALLASRMSFLVQKKYIGSLQNGFSGILLLGAGAWLALTRRGT